MPIENKEPIAEAYVQQEFSGLPQDAESWELTLKQLPINGMLRQLAANCELKQCGEDSISLTLAENQAHFLNHERQANLAKALCDWSGKQLKLDIQLATETLSQTPMARQKQRLRQRLEQAQQDLDNDRLLQDFMQRFNASIIPGSLESQAEK